MNVNSLIIKDYRKKDDFAVQKNKPNSKPISERPKMNLTLYVIKEYENETAFRLEQNKPNQTQIFPKSRYFQSCLRYAICDCLIKNCFCDVMKCAAGFAVGVVSQNGKYIIAVGGCAYA